MTTTSKRDYRGDLLDAFKRIDRVHMRRALSNYITYTDTDETLDRDLISDVVYRINVTRPSYDLEGHR